MYTHPYVHSYVCAYIHAYIHTIHSTLHTGARPEEGCSLRSRTVCCSLLRTYIHTYVHSNLCAFIHACIQPTPHCAQKRPRRRDVASALASAISSCDKSAQPKEALALLSRFTKLGVPLATVPANAAICACRHAGIGGVKEVTRCVCVFTYVCMYLPIYASLSV